MPTNSEQVKAAYAAWDASKGMNRQPLLDLMADDAVFASVAPQPPGLNFAGVQSGKAMFSAYLDGILRD